jgi:hypothetical protein
MWEWEWELAAAAVSVSVSMVVVSGGVGVLFGRWAGKEEGSEEWRGMCMLLCVSIMSFSERSPARSARQVPLLRGDILAVSSQPLQIAQRDFGVRFMCV